LLEEPTLSPDDRTLADARWTGGSSLWLLRDKPRCDPWMGSRCLGPPCGA